MWECGREGELWEEKGRGKETGAGGGKREEGSTRGRWVRGVRERQLGATPRTKEALQADDEERSEIFTATGHRDGVRISRGPWLARGGSPSGEAGWIRQKNVVTGPGIQEVEGLNA